MGVYTGPSYSQRRPAVFRPQRQAWAAHLVDVAEDLATHVLPASLLVVEDAGRRCLRDGRGEPGKETPYRHGAYQDDVAEATRREQQVDPLLDVADGDVVAGEMTPVLFKRPLSWTTILPDRWSSMISNSPM